MTALAFSRRWLRRVPSSVIVAALIAAVIIIAALAAPLDRAYKSARSCQLQPDRRGDSAASGQRAAIQRFLLGSDNQGRDVLSAIIYGARVSILIGGGRGIRSRNSGCRARPDRRFFGRPGRCGDHADRRRHPELSDDPACLACCGNRTCTDSRRHPGRNWHPLFSSAQ